MESAILSPEIGGILLFGFSLLWIFLGWWWGRGSSELEDFMLAGRKVGLALGTATAMATWVTTNTTMVAPQLALQMGIWGMVGYSLGSVGLLLFAPLAVRIRSALPQGYTSGDFIRLRFGNWAWYTFLVISIIYSLGWLVSLGMAGGILLEALSGIPYLIGMSVILALCVIYTTLGGLKAVIGTDFIQTILILFGVSLLAFLSIQELGIDSIYQSVEERRPELLNLLFPSGILFLFNNLFFGIGEIFHSNVWWSRAFAFRKDVGFKAYFLSGIFWMPIPIAAGFLALAAIQMNLNIPSPDMVGPLVAAHLLGRMGAILVFVVVFSALASSLDSLLAATSDLVLEDVYKRMFRPTAGTKELRKVATVLTLALGVVTWLVCLPRVMNLAQFLHLTGALVASTIWPIVCGLYWKRANRHAALISMLLGSTLGLVFYYQIGFYVAALAGAGISFLVMVFGSILFPSGFEWHSLKEAEE